jgi:hypothetical protein
MSILDLLLLLLLCIKREQQGNEHLPSQMQKEAK